MLNNQADDLYLRLKREHHLPFVQALALVLENNPEKLLKRMDSHNFFKAYMGLPKKEKELFFQTMAALNKDFLFWLSCCEHAESQIKRYDKLQSEVRNRYYEFLNQCSAQMAELTEDFDQLSQFYEQTDNDAVRTNIINKMKSLIKELPERV